MKMYMCMVFTAVEGLGFRAEGLGFKVQDLGFKV